MGSTSVSRCTLTRSVVPPIRRGHPWVFHDGLRGRRPEVGALVQLVDEHDAPVAWGLGDEGSIAVRVLGRGSPPAGGLEALLQDAVLRADRARTRLVAADVDCLRVLNGAGDGLPGLVLDRYAHLGVLRIYGACWEPWLELVQSVLLRLPWLELLYRRYGVKRVDGRDGGVLLHGDALPERLAVREGDVRMWVRPEEGQKTGLFLDQREHRAMVGRLAAGRTVANLFAYTGGFSVAAALGGAAHVTTVDLAAPAVADAKENFTLSGLDPDDHDFVVADAFKWRPRYPVDLWVVDPPSLTRGKQSDKAAERAYRELHERIAPLVPRDGLLCTSSCTARLSLHDWRRAVAAGLCEHGEWSWHHVSAEPMDHPTSLVHEEARYLKFAVLRRR